MRGRSALVLAHAALALSLAACAGDGAGASCGTIERLFEPASYHVLSGVEVSYRHHPPTSGPHTSTRPEPGIHDEALPEAEQVAALELGMVILHHEPGAVTGEERATLEGLAERHGQVIVTPAARPIEGDEPLAFTAWSVRQRCEALSVEAAEAFIERFVGRGPDTSGT